MSGMKYILYEFFFKLRPSLHSRGALSCILDFGVLRAGPSGRWALNLLGGRVATGRNAFCVIQHPGKASRDTAGDEAAPNYKMQTQQKKEASFGEARGLQQYTLFFYNLQESGKLCRGSDVLDFVLKIRLTSS